MFMQCSVSSSLEFWSVNHTSIYENSKSKVFKKIKFWGEISKNWLNDSLATNVQKALKSCWKSLFTILQSTNTTSVICKWSKFSPFSSLIFYF